MKCKQKCLQPKNTHNANNERLTRAGSLGRHQVCTHRCARLRPLGVAPNTRSTAGNFLRPLAAEPVLPAAAVAARRAAQCIRTQAQTWVWRRGRAGPAEKAEAEATSAAKQAVFMVA
jgi:hypothetical protein